MNIADSVVTPTASENQAPVLLNEETGDKALVNQGDTVRASWAISLDSIRSNIAYMVPEAQDLLVWAFTWCIDPAHPIRFDEFCERIGYDRNTMYKAYAGKLKTPTKKGEADKAKPMDLSNEMIKELRNFRRLEVQRAKLGRNKFVVTPTAKRVFQACDLARESQSPVFVEGASHIGKTEAFKQYCVEHNHGKSRLIEIDAIGGLHGLIQKTAVVCGISPNNRAADLTERIRRAVTRDMLLIFDEIHNLSNAHRRSSFFSCMEWVRRLVDFTQCGVVLSFTNIGFEDAERERKRELDQIFRRGVHQQNLGDRPTAKDVQMIVESWGLDFPARHSTIELEVGRTTVSEEPYKLLGQLSSERGLKAVIERLRYATKLAADTETGLTWDHFIRAHLMITKNALKPDHGWSA